MEFIFQKGRQEIKSVPCYRMVRDMGGKAKRRMRWGGVTNSDSWARDGITE